MPAPKISEFTTDQSLLGRRDAFHVPGVLVSSNETVWPGDRISFVDSTCSSVRRSDALEERQGIADPFLTNPLLPGQLFWVFIAPELTSNLVHKFDILLASAFIEKTEEKEETKLFIDVAELEQEEDVDSNDVDDEEDEDDSCKGCYE